MDIKQKVLGLIAASLIGTATPVSAVTINLTDVSFGGMTAPALAGFTSAASLWEAALVDAIDVNINIDFADLGSGILGGASSETVGVSFAAAKTALEIDATSADDSTATSSFQAGPEMTFATNDSSGAEIVDADGSGNNVFLDVNRANAKAAGILANDLALDGSITFSSTFGWDFDRSNGISAGAFDFVGVAIHEIGHVLGFVSGVDSVDITSGAGPLAPTDLNPFRVFSILDLFRYSDSAGPGLLDFRTGGDSKFSIDGGASLIAGFSTGTFNGDGRQASHWKDNAGLGIMDPTFSPGELGILTALDLQAMDVIGYDLLAVPGPQVIFVLALGLLGIGLRRKQQTH